MVYNKNCGKNIIYDTYLYNDINIYLKETRENIEKTYHQCFQIFRLRHLFFRQHIYSFQTPFLEDGFQNTNLDINKDPKVLSV